MNIFQTGRGAVCFTVVDQATGPHYKAQSKNQHPCRCESSQRDRNVFPTSLYSCEMWRLFRREATMFSKSCYRKKRQNCTCREIWACFCEQRLPLHLRPLLCIMHSHDGNVPSSVCFFNVTLECPRGGRHHFVDEENSVRRLFQRRNKCLNNLDAIFVGTVPENIPYQIHKSNII